VPAASGQVGQIAPLLHIWTGFRFESASPKCTAVLSHSMCLLLSSDEIEFDIDTVAVCRSWCQERVQSLCTDTCLFISLHWNWRTAASNQVEHNSHAAHTTATFRTQPPVPLPVLPRLQVWAADTLRDTVRGTPGCFCLIAISIYDGGYDSWSFSFCSFSIRVPLAASYLTCSSAVYCSVIPSACVLNEDNRLSVVQHSYSSSLCILPL